MSLSYGNIARISAVVPWPMKLLAWEEKLTKLPGLRYSLKTSDRLLNVLVILENIWLSKENKKLQLKSYPEWDKYRVFESLYGETSASLPVFFVFHRFRDLNYQYLPRLAELIRKSPELSDLATKSEWRNQCQEKY